MKILRIVIFSLTLLYLAGFKMIAQSKPDSIQVYLLTASPGEETYAAFGHSALRVYIPSIGYNVVYNYGTFNFSDPNFYLKFTFGRLMYSLSRYSYDAFIYSYNSWGQAIYEQKLLFKPEESIRMVELLEENYLVENRYYRYGFFYDNCATRIRDIVEKAIDGKIIYDTTYITKKETFRNLIEHYLGNTPWTFFGVNILLGTGTDSIAKLQNYMFLPEHLRDIYSRSYIKSGNCIRHLTAPPVELFPSTIIIPKTERYFYPESILSAVFIIFLFLTLFEKRKKIKLIWLDRLLFILIGLLGLLISALWIWSLHLELENNFNILWANPLNLIIGIGLFLKTRPKWLKYLTAFYAISLLCFIPISFLIMQSLPLAAYPMAGIMLVRAWGLLTYKKL